MNYAKALQYDKKKEEKPKIPKETANVSEEAPMKASTTARRKPTKQLKFGDFLEPVKAPKKIPPSKSEPVPNTVDKVQRVHNPNPASSEAFVVRRGWERETPKPKKFTKLKKVILLDREEKFKSKNENEEDSEVDPSKEEDLKPKVAELEEEAEGLSSESSDEDSDQPEKPNFAELTKIPKEPVVGPREYCDQLVTPELNTTVTHILSELKVYQDRAKLKNPEMEKPKRRYLSGLREVKRSCERKKARCVILAPNIDKVNASGGLDEITQEILKICRKQSIPTVFALSRRQLAFALGKAHVRISCVALLNYDGVNEHYRTMIELSKKGRSEFTKAERSKLVQQSQESPLPLPDDRIASTPQTDATTSKMSSHINAPSFVPSQATSQSSTSIRYMEDDTTKRMSNYIDAPSFVPSIK